MYKLTIGAAALLLSIAGATQAEIIAVDCYDGDDGSVNVNAWNWNAADSVVTIDETLHWGPGAMFVDLTLDTPGDPITSFWKDVTNDSAAAWNGYQITISRDLPFSIDSTLAPGDWSSVVTPVTYGGSEYVGIIDYYAGTSIGVGDSGLFKVTVSFLDNANFCLVQVPTLVPEPSAAMLILLPALLARRRIR
ncbi:MAG: hypothetical protein IT445_02510 [Phycisphaeraceae bacterium]|nr:hypothetical protein [Phycisphaeraceae bacterium]